MEIQPQNPVFKNNPENFHPWYKGLTFGLCLHLHPYFVYTSSEDSGESAYAPTPQSHHCFLVG